MNTAATTNPMNMAIHPFEADGLGKFPYRLTGVEEIRCQVTGKPGSSCDHCGTSIAWAFWLVSSDRKEFKVGCDCILKAGDLPLHTQAKARKARVLKDRKAAARAAERKAAEDLAQAEAEEAVRMDPELRAAFRIFLEGKALNANITPDDYWHQVLDGKKAVIRDIMHKFCQSKGFASEKQENFLRSSVRWVEDFPAMLARLEAQKASAAPVPTTNDRITIEGEVLSVWVEEGQYGVDWKMNVQTKAGWTVKGTVPASIKDTCLENGSYKKSILKGKVVSLMARVIPSRHDAKKGYFNRPTKAKVA